MNEPKTLKDILEINGIDFEEGDWGETLVDFREEAIKWIKQHQEDIELYKAGSTANQIHVDGANYVIRWIKHVFNITEEELK